MSEHTPAYSAHLALNRIFCRLDDLGQIKELGNDFDLISDVLSRKAREDNLIAAAPDMLAALQAMVNRWEPDCSGQDRVMWENACAAISKAEGRS